METIRKSEKRDRKYTFLIIIASGFIVLQLIQQAVSSKEFTESAGSHIVAPNLNTQINTDSLWKGTEFMPDKSSK